MSESREKIVTELSTGKVVTFPVLTEGDVTMGIRRRARHLKGDAQQEEFFWLALEAACSEAELEILDTLTMEEMDELSGKIAVEQELKK